MVRTIKQRIYLMSVLPLAVLAVGLVLFNGIYRIDEANRELRNAEEVMVELLSGAAAEALVLGNALTFEQAAAAAMKTSPVLICITLRDAEARVVSIAGDCSGGEPRRYFTIKAPVDGLSDFADRGRNDVPVGQIGILLSDANVVAKRRLVSIQLAVSLVLIAVVVFLVGRLLRVRLIDPIRRIDAAMQALSRRDYDADVHVPGADELARLAKEVNRTMRTIAAYTRDLERHRNDAQRALHDADESNMAREALVRSLTEELEEPLGRMHSELTAVAIANHDPALRQRIKKVLGLLQDAEANFADLIEVSSNAQPVKRSSLRDFSELISDLERDIDRLSDTERVLVNLSVTSMPPIEDRSHLYSGIVVDLDEARLRKALIYLIRAMARRCEEAGVHVNVEVIRRSVDELHISVHLKGFYTRLPEATGLKWLDELSHYANAPPSALGWTERETKIIAYLLRAVGMVPTFGTAPDGTVSIFLDTTCRFTIEPSDSQAAPDWLSAKPEVATTLVSDDATLGRLAVRGDLSNHELVIVSFSRALAEFELLRAQEVLLVDVTDIAAALALLDQLREQSDSQPNLVAICPPGHISDSLGTRLFELGFRGIVQKPLHYVRLIQVVRSVLANPLHRRGDHHSVGRR